MPEIDHIPTGAPCWIELFTSDVDRAIAFYGDLFGWEAQRSGEELGGYVNLSKGGRRIAGAMANHGDQGTPDTWTVYLATADAPAAAEAATSAGGQVVVPPMPVADLGTMAVLIDAGGAAVGAWQPGTHTGFGLLAEEGAPGWFELHTRDYDAALDWYRTVFGWGTAAVGDSPGFRYTTLGEGEEARAGVMDAAGFLPEGVPAHWSVYFVVADADAALARVEELGGSVVQAPEDTPWGRLATAADPTGARFKLMS